jgi:hypothetical protein
MEIVKPIESDLSRLTSSCLETPAEVMHTLDM